MSFDGAFFKGTQASYFFLERLWTSSVIQSGSLILGAGGRDSQAFWMENLKVSHTEFKVESDQNYLRFRLRQIGS